MTALPRGSLATTGSFFIMDRQVADCFREFPENNRVTFALVAWTGFRQTRVAYDRHARVAGASGWSIGRMLKTFYDASIGYSAFPARTMTILGFGLFLLSLIIIAWLFSIWLFTDVERGWTSLMAGITLLFGIQFMFTGVIAEYLFRIFTESTRRPLYFIRRRA
jgi:dolichol-phosphate mannosyltransferase